MNITIDIQSDHIVAAIIGDLDNASSKQAERSFEPIFEYIDRDVVIDCTEMNYISSNGLRILLKIYKHTHANGNQTLLRGMNTDVAEIFNLTGFLQLFKVIK